MQNKKISLILAILALLLLNLTAGILIKLSPSFYGDKIAMYKFAFLLVMVFGVQTLIWLFLGKHYQLSYVYPMLSINYVLSLWVGILVFDEVFVFQRFVGGIIILIGVTLITFTKHRSEKLVETKNE